MDGDWIMNYAIIFAGGVGQRMNTVSLPKQFLKVQNKEIIIHTLEHFEECEGVDRIVVVCKEEYIDLMKKLIKKYGIIKVVTIVPGGENGQESIFNGLNAANKLSTSEEDIVLIHDGVRPIITNDVILKNIECVKEHRACITVAKAIETILVLDDNEVEKVVDRTNCYLGRAPQSFYLKDIYDCHLRANAEGKHYFIDSAMLMQHYGFKMYTVEGPANNIKITTPMDFYMFKAMLDIKENEQIRIVD